MQGTTFRNRLPFAVVASCYLAAMLLSHLLVIAPQFAYRGLEFNPVSIGLLTLGSTIAILPTFWMPFNISRPSVLAYYVLYFLAYVPACVVPLCTLEYKPQRYLLYLFCIAFCFWGLARIYRINLLRLPQARCSNGLFWTVLIGVSVAINLAVIRKFGLNFHIPSLQGEIYEVRNEYYDMISGSFLAYLIMIQVKVLAPLCVIWGLYKRTFLLIAWGICSQLFIFMNAGIKTVLFSTLFIVGLYFALRISRRKLFLCMGLALMGVIGGARIADKTLDEQGIYFSSIFVRRLILTPGLLSGYYFDFYSDNPKAFYGHSVLKGFVDYPYDVAPPRIIATAYFNTEEMSCNANFWSDGYANLGLPGVILATVTLGGILWLFDSLAIDVDQRVATLVLAMPSMALVNSALSTVLLTHGLLFAMAIMHLLPPRLETKRAHAPDTPRPSTLPSTTHT